MTNEILNNQSTNVEASDSKKPNEIAVTNQAELDAISPDTDAVITVQFGTKEQPALITQEYKYPVCIVDNNVAKAQNGVVNAYDNCTIVAYNSQINAYGESNIAAYEGSVVRAFDASEVEAHDSRIEAYDSSRIEASDGSVVLAHDNSTYKLFGDSKAYKSANHYTATGIDRTIGQPSSSKNSEAVVADKAKLPKNQAISKLRISPLENSNTSVVAVVSATFYNTLVVNGMTINKGQNGLYVRMPQKMTKQGTYIDVAHPLSSEGRKNINNTVLDCFKNKQYKQEFEVNVPVDISAKNSVKYPESFGNSLARCDLLVNDMVVHNAKIINVKGTPRLNLPTYKNKDSKYSSICAPASSEVFKKFNQSAIEEYNTEYSYRKYSDSDVEKLKASGVDIQSHKNDKGENIVKFKATDADKVNAAIHPAPAQQNIAPHK